MPALTQPPDEPEYEQLVCPTQASLKTGGEQRTWRSVELHGLFESFVYVSAQRMRLLPEQETETLPTPETCPSLVSKPLIGPLNVVAPETFSALSTVTGELPLAFRFRPWSALFPVA